MEKYNKRRYLDLKCNIERLLAVDIFDIMRISFKFHM